MKKVLLFLYFLNILHFSHSQTNTFKKVLTDDLTNLTIFKNPFDNHLYLYRGNSPYYDDTSKIQIVKIDLMGNILNNIAFSHPFGTETNEVLPVPTGYLVGLSSTTYTNPKISLIKLANNYSVQWGKDYNIPYGYNFKPVYFDTVKNEILSVVSYSYFSTDSNKFFIHQADTNGLTSNFFSYEIDSLPPFKHIQNDDLIKLNNGNYVSISSISDNYSKFPVFLFLDSVFNVISGYKLIYPISVLGSRFRVIKRNDDGFLIIGWVYQSNGPPTSSFVISLSPSLIQEWGYTTSLQPFSLWFTQAQILSDNTILIVGDYQYSTSPSPLIPQDRDILILNMDSTGSVNWSKLVGIADHNERSRNFIYEENDGIYIAGIVDTNILPYLDFRGLFLKTDQLGNTNCPGSAVSIAMDPLNLSFDTVNFTKSNWSLNDSTIVISEIAGLSFISVCNGIVSVNEYQTDIASIELFPNPTTNELTVKYADLSNSELIIYNLMGSVLLRKNSWSGASEIKLDVSPLQNGIYFLEIKTKGGGAVQRFVVNR